MVSMDTGFRSLLAAQRRVRGSSLWSVGNPVFKFRDGKG